jgi:hypothetical protein
MQQSWWIEIEVTRMTTGRVPVGTRSTASLHQRSAAEGVAEKTASCMMSSTAEMHMAGLKTDAKSRSVTSRNNTMTIMAHTMTNLTGNALQKEGTFQEVSWLISKT